MEVKLCRLQSVTKSDLVESALLSPIAWTNSCQNSYVAGTSFVINICSRDFGESKAASTTSLLEVEWQRPSSIGPLPSNLAKQ